MLRRIVLCLCCVCVCGVIHKHAVFTVFVLFWVAYYVCFVLFCVAYNVCFVLCDVFELYLRFVFVLHLCLWCDHKRVVFCCVVCFV